MSDIKCPFCKETLQPIGDVDAKYPITSYYCPNNCIAFAFGNLPMWNELKRVYDSNKDLSDKIGKLELELERTRKALDVAVDALKSVRKNLCEMPDPSGATIFRMACESATTVKKALEQITALEQKDK